MEDEKQEKYVKIKKSELEELVEQKVDERIEEEKDEEKTEDEVEEEQGISRRSFLKKLGLGAGIGAMSLTPASALDIRDDNLNVYTSTGNQLNFQVNDGGPVEVRNASLQIRDGENIELRQDSSQSIDFRNRVSSGYVDLYDNKQDANSKFRVNAGGPVEVKNSHLRLDSGRNIEDDSGNKRIEIQSNSTWILDETGQIGSNSIGLRDGNDLRLQSDEQITFRDENGGFNAVKYLPSSSAPGTLELTNADLDAGSNKIKTNNFTITENSSTNSLDFNYTG